jgi:hypothetical protein
MAHGHGHRKGCKCGFCRKSASYTKHGGRRGKRGRRHGKK